MNETINQICASCRWHFPIRSHGEIRGWMCGNEESDKEGLETSYSDSCEEWEGGR